MREVFILTCEHAANRVPPPYRPLFRGHADTLKSHRGYDIGALRLACDLAKQIDAPLFTTEVTRLLVEVNRSLHHPALFSEFTRRLPDTEKERILDAYYHPHRDRVELAVAASVDQGRRVIHIGVHSFTPVLRGTMRTADLGLLYDPKRPLEKAHCEEWHRGLRAAVPELRVRRNYPYRGAADGLTTYLRTRFPADAYLGIELEVNQARLQQPAKAAALARILANTLTAQPS